MGTAISLFWRDEFGAGAVEYSILLGCIAVVVIVGIGALGNAVLTRLYNQATTIFPS